MNFIDQEDKVLSWLAHLASLLPIIGIVLLILVLVGLVLRLLVKLLRIKHHVEEKAVCLELTPPAFDDKLPEATSQLFVALHGIISQKRTLINILETNPSLALEIVSTRSEGIRFVVSVNQKLAEAVTQTIHAYLPEVKVKRVADYMSNRDTTRKMKITSYQQTTHFAYPLKTGESLANHDPLSYLTGAMTKLGDNELMALQLVIQPIVSLEAARLSQKILTNEDIHPSLYRSHVSLAKKIFYLINRAVFGVMELFSSILHGSSKQGHQMAQFDLYYRKQVALNLRPARSLSAFEQQLMADIHDKLAEPLFETSIRSVLVADSPRRTKLRQKSLKSALGLYSTPKYQSIKPKHSMLSSLSRAAYLYRLGAVFGKANTLSAGELAGLYHFPNSYSAKTENVVKSLSKTLPAHISLKNGQKLDVILGESRHQGAVTPIGLTTAERERHVYVIGGTGNGKTTMLMYSIVQDIEAGKGLAVVDPHGDLAETLLGYIPEDRIDDVIYLNPDDLTHPIGINLLELTEGLEGDELLREKDLVTESTISVLRKIFSEDDSGGHRIEYILRNTIQTALTLDNPTLFTIFRLLNDTKYRQSVVRKLEDKDLVNFWRNELAKAGEMQRVKMSAGITAKVGRFLFSASAKRVLEQEKSSINFEDILDKKKILICNFSKGLIGEDTSTLFGTTILAKLQVAALRRARYKQIDRQPFHLYVDEFQNFATMSFVEMLSEARKYKLYLTMAEQSTQQQERQRLVDIVLANVGTVICFRSGSPADERLVLPLFKPYINEGEIANLPAYNFYMRIVAVEAKEPMSGVTLLLGNQADSMIADAVVETSRNKYGRKVLKTETINKPEPGIKVPDKAEEKVVGSVGRPSRSDQIAVAGK